MSRVSITRSRTGWDVVLGIGLFIVGLVILGNAVVATKVSVLFLGWMLLLAGIIGLISALVNIRTGGFWPSAIAGSLFLVVGLMCLRHTQAAALTLTLIAGALFLTTGLVRLIAAVDNVEYRWPLILGGSISTILGLIVLLNLYEASYALLGVLLGIQALCEGLAIMLVGRVRIRGTDDDALAPSV